MTNVNVEVGKNQNENAINLIRRFTKRMQGSGVLRRVRKIRFHARPDSDYKRKTRTLRGIARHKEIEKQKKLGKIPS